MNISTRSITLRDDGIYVDVVWEQEAGCIFEARVIPWRDMTLGENIAFELGDEATIEGTVVDLRTVDAPNPDLN